MPTAFAPGGLTAPGNHPGQPLFRRPTELARQSTATSPYAAPVASVAHGCFARWSYNGTQYAVGTTSAYRSAQWHDPVLRGAISLAQGFSDSGVQQGGEITLDIADGPGGTYRLLLGNYVLDGTIATVESVTTVTYTDGSTSELSRTQQLTIMGAKLRQGRVLITCVDIEDERLAALYPSALYDTTNFPNVDSGDANKAIAFPVGTALKIPCALIEQVDVAMDASANQAPRWLYGVCELEWQSFPIVAADTGTDYFGLDGDQTAYFNVGDAFWVFDPIDPHNVVHQGRYVVTAVDYGTTIPFRTAVYVAAVGASTVTSYINVPPRVLSVYRNGRLVASTEYTVEVMDNAVDDFAVGVGDMSDTAPWANGFGTTGSGTGTGEVFGAPYYSMTLSGDGGTTNYGYGCHAQFYSGTYDNAGRTWRRHQYVPMRVSCGGSESLRVWTNCSITPIAFAHGSILLSGAGSREFYAYPTVSSADDRRIMFSTYNSGYSGAVSIDDLTIEQPAKPLVLLRFYAEQRDYSGNLYTITADVYGYRSRNAVREVERLLGEVGAIAESSSFGYATTYSTDTSMLVDCTHGREGQRRVRAIVEDLLFIARATIFRNGGGQYEIAQDKAVVSARELDEALGDLIEVEELDAPARPKTVALRYKPNPVDPTQFQHTITRTVTGGVIGDQAPIDVPFLTDHTAADRLLCYLALRAQYNRRMSGRLLLAAADIGTALSVASQAAYDGTRDWFVWQSSTTPAGLAIEALEYSDAVHAYTPATLPADAVLVYQPDYSKTPPLTPTSLAILTSTSSTGGGATIARITVEVVPPAVNWSEIWFATVHNTTGEISIALGTYNASTGKATATIGAMRPTQVYQLKAWAVNNNAVQGVVLSTFNATAIGGGATDTTFTSSA